MPIISFLIGAIDFSPATGELTFTPTNQGIQLHFRVNILDDTDPEVTEEFLARLTTDQDRVLLDPNEMIIEIVDDDSKIRACTFSSLSFKYHVGLDLEYSLLMFSYRYISLSIDSFFFFLKQHYCHVT